MIIVHYCYIDVNMTQTISCRENLFSNEMYDLVQNRTSFKLIDSKTIPKSGISTAAIVIFTHGEVNTHINTCQKETKSKNLPSIFYSTDLKR